MSRNRKLVVLVSAGIVLLAVLALAFYLQQPRVDPVLTQLEQAQRERDSLMAAIQANAKAIQATNPALDELRKELAILKESLNRALRPPTYQPYEGTDADLARAVDSLYRQRAAR